MSIIRMDGNTVQLLENSGGLIRTITNEAVAAQLSPDESRVLVVNRSGKAQLWDSRGNHLMDLGRAVDARFSGDQMLIETPSGSTEVLDSRGNLLRTLR